MCYLIKIKNFVGDKWYTINKFTFRAPSTQSDRASLALNNGCKLLELDAYSTS